LFLLMLSDPQLLPSRLHLYKHHTQAVPSLKIETDCIAMEFRHMRSTYQLLYLSSFLISASLILIFREPCWLFKRAQCGSPLRVQPRTTYGI
jgi:hypothetical protein